jgi:hypothetical protein
MATEVKHVVKVAPKKRAITTLGKTEANRRMMQSRNKWSSKSKLHR